MAVEELFRQCQRPLCCAPYGGERLEAGGIVEVDILFPSELSFAKDEDPRVGGRELLTGSSGLIDTEPDAVAKALRRGPLRSRTLDDTAKACRMSWRNMVARRGSGQEWHTPLAAGNLLLVLTNKIDFLR